MRISDWSSDVCSSDLRRLLNILAYLTIALSLGTTATAHVLERPDVSASSHEARVDEVALGHVPGDADQVPSDSDKGYPHHHGGCHGDHVAAPVKAINTALTHDRSEEHTSELQSLMRISYAVFCLKKKK